MDSFKFFFIFLFVFFVAFPVALNFPPKSISRFFHRRQNLPSYGKFISLLLAISMVAFNTIYFACFHFTVGLLLSSCLMFALFNKQLSVLIMQSLRNSDKRMIIHALVLLAMALSHYTFPIAIIQGLVQLFACLMPKSVRAEIASHADDANPVSDVTAQTAEPITTSTSEEATTDMEPESSTEAETDSSNPNEEPSAVDDSPKQDGHTEQPSSGGNSQQVNKTSKNPKSASDSHRTSAKNANRSEHPNRHPNRTHLKRFAKQSSASFASGNPSKFSHKSNRFNSHRRHG